MKKLADLAKEPALTVYQTSHQKCMWWFGLPEIIVILASISFVCIYKLTWTYVDVGQICNINTYEVESELGICKNCIDRLGPTCKECDEEKYCKTCINNQHTQFRNKQGWSLCIKC